MPKSKKAIIESIQKDRKDAKEYISKIENAVTDLLENSDKAFTSSEIADILLADNAFISSEIAGILLADIPLKIRNAIQGHICLIRERKNVFVSEIDGETYYCMESPSVPLVDK